MIKAMFHQNDGETWLFYLLHIQNAVLILILAFKNDTQFGSNMGGKRRKVIVKRKLKKYKIRKTSYFQAFCKHSKLIPPIKIDNLQKFAWQIY